MYFFCKISQFTWVPSNKGTDGLCQGLARPVTKLQYLESFSHEMELVSSLVDHLVI
jgi:hypothetical protein